MSQRDFCRIGTFQHSMPGFLSRCTGYALATRYVWCQPYAYHWVYDPPLRHREQHTRDQSYGEPCVS